jgi:alpha-ketoglutarate-dependent taurine dioxygenase
MSITKDLEVNLETDDIIDMIAENCGIYQHQWEEGDMLIWDNV